VNTDNTPTHVQTPVLFTKEQLVRMGEPGADIVSAFTEFVIVRPMRETFAASDSHVEPGQENTVAPVPASEYVPDGKVWPQLRTPV
jgi:hypothetical protein